MIGFDDAITSNTLIPKSFMAFRVNRFANYEGYYRGRPTVQTNKPVQQFQFENSNCQTSSAVPVGKPKRKPELQPGSSGFCSDDGWKAL